MKVWTTITSLRTATFVSRDAIERTVGLVFDDNKKVEWILESFVHGTIEEALEACENNASYWEGKADDLRYEINREKGKEILARFAQPEAYAQPIIDEIKKL